MNDSIAEKVSQMKMGQEEAFDWLYKAYVKKLYGMAYFITGNKSDSEDIVQEAFVKCFLKRNSIQEEQAFEAWLYRILVRTAWKYQKQRKSNDSLEELNENGWESEFGQWIQTDYKEVQPLEKVILQEQNLRLYQAVRQLEMKQRTVILLYYFNQLSVKEIALVTGSLSGTVKSRLFKARQNLRKILEERDIQAGKSVGREILE